MEMIEVRMQMTEEIAVTVLAMGVSNIWTCGVLLDENDGKETATTIEFVVLEKWLGYLQ